MPGSGLELDFCLCVGPVTGMLTICKAQDRAAGNPRGVSLAF